jgi:hypothetical protein
VFDGEGRFEAEWPHVHRPRALCKGAGDSGLFYVGEVDPSLAVNRHVPNLGPRISVLTADGEIVARIGDDG